MDPLHDTTLVAIAIIYSLKDLTSNERTLHSFNVDRRADDIDWFFADAET
jgi:hypothetical protein